MKKIVVFLFVTVFCLSMSSGIFAQENQYQDVNETDWYYEYVTLLTERGIMTGVIDNEFQPNRNITRAEFIKVIANIDLVDLSLYNGITPFQDVPDDAWYANVVQWAYESGLIQGVSAVEFMPNEPITREQIIVIINRYTDTVDGFVYPEFSEREQFNDHFAISDWAKASVELAQIANIICGDDNNNFNPQNYAKRSEVAKIVSTIYMYLASFETYQYVENNKELLELEIENAQESMAELASDPSTASYFQNAPIFANTISPMGFVGGGFQFLDGDILYTNGTYYFGHIGMACGNKILEILNDGVRLTSYSTWANRYSDRVTYVLRRIPEYCNGNTNCRDVSVDAAWYGSQYFVNGAGNNYDWQLLPPLSSTTKINCSGLAYKCYRDGAGFYYKISYVDPNTGNRSYINPSYITPDDILNDRVYNGFSAIHSF